MRKPRWQTVALVALAIYTAALHWRLSRMADELPYADPVTGLTDSEQAILDGQADDLAALEARISALEPPPRFLPPRPEPATPDPTAP